VRPLENLKVIDVGTAMAGPYATSLLGDMGADVLKVEKPGRGDLLRYTDRYISGESGYFLGINHGKSGMTADLRKPEGQEIIRRLVRSADVLVENYRGDRMAKWNLSYEALREVNPQLIYCSLSMFSDDIPGYENLVGNDKIAQAISGLMANTGEADGAPTRLGAPIVDAAGGFLCALGILGALHRRDREGVGEHVKVSLLEAAYALMPPWIPSILNGEADFTRHGHKHPLLAPYQLFKASDGKYMVIGAFHQESWRRLCIEIGREELIDDSRFLSNLERVKNRDILDPIIESEILKHAAAEWQERLERAVVPVAPVLSIRESVELFAKTAPQLLRTVSDDKLGDLLMLRPAIRFESDSVAEKTGRGAPALSVNTDEVLRSLGYTDEELEAFRANKVI
jgi:crotonobetainyl-CoA:carnitine CoA-transferase CaiB-like acyl-CoA transferase